MSRLVQLLFLISLVQWTTAELYPSMKFWLNLQFLNDSSKQPVGDLRVPVPLGFPIWYSRDDLDGTHTLPMDYIPEIFHLEVSNEADSTRLSLSPRRQSQTVHFNIKDNLYELKYNISCKMGFYGEECDRMCLVVPGRHYSCSEQGEKICHEGWTGDNCDKKADSCSSNPCQNGGICQMDGPKQFTCSCGFGFEGLLCERKSNVTSEIPIDFIKVIALVICVSTIAFLVAFVLYFKKSATRQVKSTVPVYILHPFQMKKFTTVDIEKASMPIPFFSELHV